MNLETVSIEKIIKNPENPRIIKNDKFELLKKSIVKFPEMLKLREIVVDEDYMILGGNMRYEALKELGYKEITVKVASGLTDEQKKEFIIKDNANFGEWDYDELANCWNIDELGEWGVDLHGWGVVDEESEYSTKIASPIYEMTCEQAPTTSELYDLEYYNKLIKDIDKAELSDDDREFLKFAAARHIVYNYGKIAEFYAHAEKPVQELMEDSALVIIDFNKAIEKGFARITDWNSAVVKIIDQKYKK